MSKLKSMNFVGKMSNSRVNSQILIHFISVHIWTILLDVMAGIGVMFWLWHISNAGDYLIHLAMVNITVSTDFSTEISQ